MDLIPLDIWTSIFLHLPYEDLRRQSRLNRQIYSLLQDESFWRLKYSHDYPNISEDPSIPPSMAYFIEYDRDPYRMGRDSYPRRNRCLERAVKTGDWFRYRYFRFIGAEAVFNPGIYDAVAGGDGRIVADILRDHPHYCLKERDYRRFAEIALQNGRSDLALSYLKILQHCFPINREVQNLGHYHAMQTSAAESGNIEAYDLLTSYFGASNFGIALEYAIGSRNDHMVDHILKTAPITKYQIDTAIIKAGEMGNREIIRKLRDRGGDVNRALLGASRRNNPSLIAELIREGATDLLGSLREASSTHGPVNYLIDQGIDDMAEVAEILIRGGNIDTFKHYQSRFSPEKVLEAGVQWDDVEMVVTALSLNPTNINSALLLALADDESEEMVDVLLSHGASNGDEALIYLGHHAGEVSVAKILCRHFTFSSETLRKAIMASAFPHHSDERNRDLLDYLLTQEDYRDEILDWAREEGDTQLLRHLGVDW